VIFDIDFVIKSAVEFGYCLLHHSVVSVSASKPLINGKVLNW
jgi:hypothetical protein